MGAANIHIVGRRANFKSNPARDNAAAKSKSSPRHRAKSHPRAGRKDSSSRGVPERQAPLCGLVRIATHRARECGC